MVLNCPIRKYISQEGKSYEYLGVLEANEVMVNEMRDKVKKE